MSGVMLLASLCYGDKLPTTAEEDKGEKDGGQESSAVRACWYLISPSQSFDVGIRINFSHG